VFCQPIGIATVLAVVPKAQRYNTLELSCPVWQRLIGERLVLGLTKELGAWVMRYSYKNKLERVVQFWFLPYTLKFISFMYILRPHILLHNFVKSTQINRKKKNGFNHVHLREVYFQVLRNKSALGI
jgi:hypothetical protein